MVWKLVDTILSNLKTGGMKSPSGFEFHPSRALALTLDSQVERCDTEVLRSILRALFHK